MMNTRFVVLSFVLLAAGCGPSAKESFERDRPAAEERIRLIDEFAKAIEAGKASKAELKLPEGLKLEISSDTAPTNTLTLQWDDVVLRAPDQGAKLKFVFGAGAALYNLRGSLNDPRPDVENAIKNVKSVLTPRYLCVVHIEKLTLPLADLKAKTFTPGSVEFRVYVFDMVEKKELGSVGGKAENEAKVEVRGKYKTDEQLTTDLATNADNEFKKIMKPYSWR